MANIIKKAVSRLISSRSVSLHQYASRLPHGEAVRLARGLIADGHSRVLLAPGRDGWSVRHG
ncbi:hypothetical protein LH460_06455 [Laribacter hongkongensis]|uniref:hypothetical protein n=1 Tax=Laribacter hongkongensis TaxID=168471 RepID=UPI001EFD8131|nr:hypothetical protein [Laribacter hongkongensis]MCG9124313.1 hypothetical protein [Laribacter hongkongensis]